MFVMMPPLPEDRPEGHMVDRAIHRIVAGHNNLDVEQLALDLEIDVREAWDVVVEAMYCLPVVVDTYSRARAH